jgi:hypothetical protein
MIEKSDSSAIDEAEPVAFRNAVFAALTNSTVEHFRPKSFKPLEEREDTIRVKPSDAVTRSIKSDSFRTLGLEARRIRGWGELYEPEPEEAQSFRQFKEIVAKLPKIAAGMREVLEGETISDTIADVAEMDALLGELFKCKWGTYESLKKIVVAIRAQTMNCRLERPQLHFLVAAGEFLSTAYVIDDSAVDYLHSMIERHALDPYRGTLSDYGFVKKYRIVEVTGGEERDAAAASSPA